MFTKRVFKIPLMVMCVLITATLVIAGCGEEKVDTSKSVYKIGVVLSLTGPAAPLGEPEQRALMLLEEELNNGAGVDGHQVKFIIEDDASQPEKAAAAMNKLISQEKVPAVIGSSTTGATLAMAPIAQSSKVPLVCCAAGTKITQPVNEWVFRTPPSDSMAIEKVLDYLENTLKVKKIAILHDANAFGTGGADELSKKAADASVEIVARESYGSTDTDMTAQLTKIKGTDAETIVVWGTNPGPASIAKNMQQLAMDLPYVGSHGIANKKFIELAGTAANGVVFPAGKLLIPESIEAGSDWRKAVDKFAKAYKDKYNMEIDTFAAHGYDAGMIVTEAMKVAGTGTDSQKIRDAIEGLTEFVGIDGLYTYSAKDHDGLSVDDLMMIEVKDADWVEKTS